MLSKLESKLSAQKSWGVKNNIGASKSHRFGFAAQDKSAKNRINRQKGTNFVEDYLDKS